MGDLRVAGQKYYAGSTRNAKKLSHGASSTARPSLHVFSTLTARRHNIPTDNSGRGEVDGKMEFSGHNLKLEFNESGIE